jgi:transcriptional regulator with XRE-family HTH domain
VVDIPSDLCEIVHKMRMTKTKKDAARGTRVERLYTLIGERVQRGRKELSLTQEQLAVQAGLTRTSITNLESGNQYAPLHVLLAIADTLGMELADLVPGRDELKVAPPMDAFRRLEIGNGLVKMIPPSIADVIAARGGSNLTQDEKGANR